MEQVPSRTKQKDVEYYEFRDALCRENANIQKDGVFSTHSTYYVYSKPTTSVPEGLSASKALH